jgi:hypothetical protein
VHFSENPETCTVLIILASRLTAANVTTLKTFKMYGNDGECILFSGIDDSAKRS